MKNQFRPILLAALGLTLVSSARAESYGDLIAGFTTQSGNDAMVDLGNITTITDGETWSASFLGISPGLVASYQWGVVGDATVAQDSYPVDTLYVSTFGLRPTATGNIGTPDTGINALLSNFPGGQYNTNPGDSAVPAFGTDNSWNTEAIKGTLATDLDNSVGPIITVTGATSDSFWQVKANVNNTPTKIGSFSLSSAGVLTYNIVSTSTPPPTASFTGTPVVGFAPLKVVFINTSTGSVTNSLWNFGDGHTLTNTNIGNVTNLYASVGNYTVTLKTTGPGGSSTNTVSNYILVSPTPTFGNMTFTAGKLVFSGINCPPGVQYRILSTTNLALPVASWTPMVTNTFLSNGSYAYTNGTAANGQVFFRLVSP